MLHPLDRKLLRDLRQQWGQLLAIALVVACGIACFVLMRSAYDSLQLTQSAYYERERFADVFAELQRAPNRLAEEIAAIPGVQQVQTRIVVDVTLAVPGLPEPASGRLISVPPDGEPVLNAYERQRGQPLDPQRPGEVLASVAFAEANQLELGDSVGAILNGRWQDLQLTGLALSPEYVYAVKGGGDIYPDNRRFGIFWLNETALAEAFDLDGAFNSVALTLTPDANEAAVLADLDRLLEPYGGLGAYGRDEQISNRMLDDEIRSLEVSATIMPTLFLAIAAFLLHVILSRLIATQREQIAVLKAFGYSNGQVGGHYLKFVLLVVSVGALLGIGLGLWLGRGLTAIYTELFQFPLLRYVADPRLLAIALLVSGGAATLGGLVAVRQAIDLPPAQAMRPEPPASFRATLVERWGLQRWLSPAGRIVLRNLERRPLRASLSTLGIAIAAAILLTGFYLTDAVERLMQVQFQWVQREDVTVVFNEPRPARVETALAQLPGVLRVEGFRSVPARLRHGHDRYRLALTGLEPGSQFRRLINQDLQAVPLPPEGVMLTAKLAEILHIQPGELLTVEVLAGDRPTRQVPVVGLVEETIGVSAYMELAALNRLLREGRTLSGAYLGIDPQAAEALYAELKQIPAIAGVSFRDAMLTSFEEISAQNLQTVTGILVLFAAIITFSVVYNSARIALSERSRELASLRILGFTQGEIGSILLGEQAVLTVLAIPLGYGFGYGLAALMSRAYDSELYRIPLIVTRAAYGWTLLVVLLAAIASGLAIRRQLQHLDLIAVLKTRE